jgi:hypothetical protein
MSIENKKRVRKQIQIEWLSGTREKGIMKLYSRIPVGLLVVRLVVE